MRICVVRNSEAEITTSFYRIVDAILASENIPLIVSRKRECDKPGIEHRKYVFQNSKIDNFEIRIKAKRGGGVRNIFQLVLYQIKLFKWLMCNKDKYDVIHSFDLDAGIPCYIICKIYNMRHIYHIADFYSDSRQMPKLLRKVFRKIEMDIINKSQDVIICNEQRVEQIKGHKREKIEIIHNTPVLTQDLSNFINTYHKNEEERNKLKICYVGALKESRFIKIALDTIKEFDTIEINIAGVGECEEYVKELSIKNENINYHGKLKYEDAIKLYLESDLMFAIYDPRVENHKFSAPNKIYEAMILGKPIIVAENTGMDEIVRKYDMGKVINYSQEDFREVLVNLNNEKSNLISMGERAYSAYKDYNWDKMKNRLVRLYND